jgi:hypothetical protein
MAKVKPIEIVVKFSEFNPEFVAAAFIEALQKNIGNIRNLIIDLSEPHDYIVVSPRKKKCAK